MQGEDALRTVEECLRGRLLAERAASKAAKETTDLLTTKMKELEEKLKIEEKCRRKAEKRLSTLKKKLESLKIEFSISEESDECSSSTLFSTDHVSETSSANSISPTTTTSSSSSVFRSDSGDQMHTQQPKSSNWSISCNSKRENNADQGERMEEKSKMEHVNVQDQQYHSKSHCGLSPSELEEKRSKEDDEKDDDDYDEHDDDDDFDNSMALVLSTPVESAEKPLNREIKVNDEGVRQVLDTLKQIRENLQYTMERRRIVQLG